MANPILVTGVAGRVGSVGPAITQLLLRQGEAVCVRACTEDRATDPQSHIGKIHHLTDPQSENMDFFAQEYSKALRRAITYKDIPLEQWLNGLPGLGLPVAGLHRAGGYDRMSNDVLMITKQAPTSVQKLVRKNALAFSASANAA